MKVHRRSKPLLPTYLVWDADDILRLRATFRGNPRVPRVPWCGRTRIHQRLRRSLRDGKIFDQPPQTAQRYLVEKPVRQVFGWRFNNKARSVPRHRKKTPSASCSPPRSGSLEYRRLEEFARRSTRDNAGLGIYTLDLPTASLPGGSKVVFTFYWPNEDRWEGKDYSVIVE